MRFAVHQREPSTAELAEELGISGGLAAELRGLRRADRTRLPEPASPDGPSWFSYSELPPPDEVAVCASWF